MLIYNIGKALRKLRLASEKTHEDLGDVLSPVTWSRIENGRQDIRMNNLIEVLGAWDRQCMGLIHIVANEKQYFILEHKMNIYMNLNDLNSDYILEELRLIKMFSAKEDRYFILSTEALLALSYNPAISLKMITDEVSIDEQYVSGSLCIDEMFLIYVYAIANSRCGKLDLAISCLSKLNDSLRRNSYSVKSKIRFLFAKQLANILLEAKRYVECLDICNQSITDIALLDVHYSTWINFFLIKAKIYNILGERGFCRKLLNQIYDVCQLFYLTKIMIELKAFASENTYSLNDDSILETQKALKNQDFG